MKTFLGVPVIKSEDWTGLGWSLLTALFMYGVVALLTLNITGEFQESVSHATTILCLVLGAIFFHLFKYFTNMWVLTSYYSPKNVVLQVIVMIILYFVIKQ